MASDQEKTHPATPRKLSKARQEGSVPKSQDLGSAAVLITGIVTLWLYGPAMGEKIQYAFRAIHGNLLNVTLTADNVAYYVKLGGFFFLKLLFPFVAAIFLTGIIINLFQTGILFTTKPLKPDLKKISPLKGLKRIFSSRGLVELAKGLAKLIIVSIVAYLHVRAHIPDFIKLMDQDIAAIISGMLGIMLKLAFKLALIMLILGIIDWIYQKWKHKEDMKMTKQEVTDERKSSEGDPKVKQKIRNIQFRASLNRMIKEIPDADLVVVNPVHIAVALKYDTESMKAPRVIAKGKRKLALRIRSIAEENNIPIIEDPQLARMLYKTCEVGWEVPYELFQAVAEVLAMVYRLKEAA